MTGPELRIAREARGLTLGQLAVAAGITAEYLMRIESSMLTPPSKVLISLLESLNLAHLVPETAKQGLTASPRNRPKHRPNAQAAARDKIATAERLFKDGQWGLCAAACIGACALKEHADGLRFPKAYVLKDLLPFAVDFSRIDTASPDASGFRLGPVDQLLAKKILQMAARFVGQPRA